MSIEVKETQTMQSFTFAGVAIPDQYRAGSNSFDMSDAIASFNDGKADDKSLIANIRNKRMNQGLALILRGISQVVEYRNSTFLAQVISRAKLSPLEKHVIQVVLPNAGYSASKGKILWEECPIVPEGCEMSHAACVNTKALAELVNAVRTGHSSGGVPKSNDPKTDGFNAYFKREKTDEEKAKAAQESLSKAIEKGLIDRATLAELIADMPKEKS